MKKTTNKKKQVASVTVTNPYKVMNDLTKDFVGYVIQLERKERNEIREKFLKEQFEGFLFTMSQEGLNVVNAYDIYNSIVSQTKKDGVKDIVKSMGIKIDKLVSKEAKQLINQYLVRLGVATKQGARKATIEIDKTFKALEVELERGNIASFNDICDKSFGINQKFTQKQFEIMQKHHVKDMDTTNQFKPYFLKIMKAMAIKQNGLTEKRYQGLYKATIKNVPYMLQSELESEKGIPTLKAAEICKFYLTPSINQSLDNDYSLQCAYIRKMAKNNQIPVYPDVLIEKCQEQAEQAKAEAEKVQAKQNKQKAEQAKADIQAVKEYQEQHADDIPSVEKK